jgi:energy-coupling factor transporter ATP-binding protein EcfA2
MVDLACILAHEPRVILFDEPSSGIAQKESEALGPLLKKVRDLTGSSLLVIEHDMPLLTSLADEIVALDLGRVICRGAPHEVVRDPLVVAAYLGADTAAVSRSGILPGRASGNGRRRTSRNGARKRSATRGSAARQALGRGQGSVRRRVRRGDGGPDRRRTKR